MINCDLCNKPFQNKAALVQHVKFKVCLKPAKRRNMGVGSTPEIEKIRCEQISATMKAKGCGGLRKGSGRGIKQWYESPIAGRIYLRSSLELRYAQKLDAQGINWRQPTESFPYTFNGTVRSYYPDFYLIDDNLYVETKGFKTLQDEAKWSQFPHTLQVLYEKDV